MERLGKYFVQLQGEESRYEEVNSYVYKNNILKTESEIKKAARREINLFQRFAEGVNPESRYYDICNNMRNIRFDGKVIIRPFNSLYEATVDGIMGTYDSGLIAETIDYEDGYLFAIRIPRFENKAFGYVWYNPDGTVRQARQAFCLDIQNKVVLKYIELFSRDILLPALRQKEKKTA